MGLSRGLCLVSCLLRRRGFSKELCLVPCLLRRRGFLQGAVFSPLFTEKDREFSRGFVWYPVYSEGWGSPGGFVWSPVYSEGGGAVLQGALFGPLFTEKEEGPFSRGLCLVSCLLRRMGLSRGLCLNMYCRWLLLRFLCMLVLLDCLIVWLLVCWTV